MNLNRKAAEVLGLDFIVTDKTNKVLLFTKEFDNEHRFYNTPFDPEHNRNHADMLLDKVAEEGRGDDFIDQLYVIVLDDWMENKNATSIDWYYVHVTPAQITEAFCKTMEVRE